MDKISRSLIKTLTYRVAGSVILIVATYLITGNLTLSIAVGGLEFIIKLIMYFLHERFWNLISWGKSDGKIIWLTGLSGSGKTTIADNLIKKMKRKGNNVVILDGDNVRNIFPNTGFTKKDRDEHIKRMGRTSLLFADSGIDVICTFISPYRNIRNEIKNLAVKNNIKFIEVYVNCSLDVCIERDTKGLYKKAIAGEIKNFTGISQKYEEPENPNITVYTDKETVKESVKKILIELKHGNLLKIIW